MAPAIPSLTTDRLLLPPLELADAPAIQEHFAQWEIVKLMTNHIPWPYPPDGAVAFVRDVALPGMENGTAWHWSMRLKTEPDQLIGCVSLRDKADGNRGFWVGLPWQGRGYATEACAAATGFWFETLARPILRAPKAAANTPSRRISQTSGMRLIAIVERDFVSGRQPAEMWEITREEWLARQAKDSEHAR